MKLTLVFIILHATHAHSQNKTNIDVCNKYLKNAEEFALSHLDSMLLYAQKANILASKELKNSKSPEFIKIKGNALTSIGYYYFMSAQPNKALSFCDSAYKLLSYIKDNRSLSSCCSNLAAIYENEGDIAKSRIYFSKSLNFAKLANDSLGIADSFNSLAYLEISTGNILNGINYFEKALGIQNKIHDSIGIANTLYNLGSVYIGQGESENGIEYLNKANNIFKTIGDKQAEVNIYYALSNAYSSLNNLNLYKAYSYKALQLAIKIKDQKMQADCNINLSNYYNSLKEYDSVEVYAKKARMNCENTGNKKALCLSLKNLAIVYLKRDNNYKLSEEFAIQSYEIAKELGYVKEMQDASKLLSYLYKHLKQYEKALNYYTLYNLYRDSINNDVTKKAAIKNKFKAEYEARETTIKNKNEYEKGLITAKAEEDNKRQSIIIYSVSAILILVIILVITTFISLKNNKAKNALIELQKQALQHKQTEIIDSIIYAERIQRSFLATKEHLDAHLKEYSILFKPKDIVSGDFYWSSTLNNGYFILVTADSTGHGVPGAIMSLLNITSLEKAIETETEPSAILNTTRKIIIDRLKKDGSTEGGKDGMDCSVCVYDLKNKKLIAAAANNPIWIIRGKELIEIKGDKMPVGKHDKEKTPFTQHEIQLQDNDLVYTLTDGYADQFGGDTGKKFMSKNLKELILSNSHLSLTEQKQNLDSTFVNWAKTIEQIDDVTIVGIRI